MDYKFQVEAIDEGAFDRAYAEFQKQNPPTSSVFPPTREMFAQIAFEQGVMSLDPSNKQ